MSKKVIVFFKNIFEIRDSTEVEEKAIQSIRKNVAFKGARLWTLIFAIVIASIGLNINSIAIIIGAMLISPLMGPILGLGLSLGINDSPLLKKSLKSLATATIIGIIISTLYFYFSPIHNVQSELLARISPTIYDVLIAFLGGFVGIIGSTRMEKGNVIPGVAIATALIPPLCTVGYGIATGQPKFFLGALFLYTINCIFICVATFIGVKYLKFPRVSRESKKHSVKLKIVIGIVVVAMIAPAVYLGYIFIQKNNFQHNTITYIQDTFISKGYHVIYSNTNYDNSPHTIELAFLSKRFSDIEIQQFQSTLIDYGLSNTVLSIKQDNAFLTQSQWDEVIANIQDEGEKVKAIEAKLISATERSNITEQVLIEAQSINNKVSKLAIGTVSFTADEQPVQTILLYTSSLLDPITIEEKNQLITWLKSRMQNENVLVYFLE